MSERAAAVLTVQSEAHRETLMTRMMVMSERAAAVLTVQSEGHRETD